MNKTSVALSLTRMSALMLRYHIVVALCCLTILELLCFGPIVHHVGFYLDDWTTMFVLKFGPQSLGPLLVHYFTGDVKVIIRPVEVLHFGLLYKMFGLNPLGYHVANGVLEILSAWLFYLCALRFSAKKSLAFLSAVLLLLLPLHDSTHYWVLASSVTLSLATYLASLLFTMEYVKTKRSLFIPLSAFAFLLSIFSYESFVPLGLLNIAYVIIMTPKTHERVTAILKGVLPIGVSVFALLIFQKVIMPHFGQCWGHAITFSPSNMASTLMTGVKICLPTETLPFFARLIELQFAQQISSAQLLYLALSALTTLVVFAVFYRSETHTYREYFTLSIVGIFVVLLSYSIFGLNPEYVPTLSTILNRINAGASMGVGLIMAAIIGAAIQACSNSQAKQVLATVAIAGTVIFLNLSNWAMAHPWIISWQAQKHIWQLVENQRGRIKRDDSLILANCPRYAMWSPVFDGVWDFQSMVRLALNDEQARAGVVSERLKFSKDKISDISAGFLCAEYPYQGMYLIFPQMRQPVAIHSAQELVSQIRDKGMAFGLDKNAVDNWQRQVSISALSKGNAL